MINAIPITQLELPAPVQSAPASAPTKGFSQVRDSVFEMLGLKQSDLKEAETAADTGLLAAWLFAPNVPQEAQAAVETINISKCADPAKGIVSILEGFGLLNANGKPTDEAEALLLAAYEAAGAAAGDPGAEPAGMPVDAEDFSALILRAGKAEGAPTEARPALREDVLSLLTPLVGDDLKSLENAQGQNGAAESIPQTAAAPSGAEVFQKLVSAIGQALSGQEATVAPKGDEAEKFPTIAPHAPQTGAFGAELTNAAAEGMPLEAVTTGETVLDIVERMHAKGQEGASEFELTLKPEHLGKLSIKLTQEGGAIKAEIKAADAAVRSLLEHEASALTEQLRAKGIEVTKIDVAFEASTLAFDARQMQNRQGSGAEGSKRRPSMAGVSRTAAYGTAEAADPAAQNAARLVLQGSSVEFSA